MTTSHIDTPMPFERPRGVLSMLKAYFSTNRIGDLLLLQGRITPDQLTQALALARLERRRIGHVLVEQRYIRRHELYALLGKQWGVRSLAWGVAMFMSVGSIAPRSARADEASGTTYSSTQVLRNTAAMRLPSEARAIAPLHSYPALFGSAEKRSGDLSAFTKWASMFSRYDAQLQTDSAKAVLVDWKKNLNSISEGNIGEMARAVDARLNSIEYIEDKNNYGRSDYWATPVEFFRNGGDCEDYAIAKYMSLKSMGVPEERLRIAIVQDLIKNIPHAVLIVYAEEGPLVLDNQSKVTRRADDVTRYKPIFSINRTAWWLHTRGADMQVASAAR